MDIKFTVRFVGFLVLPFLIGAASAQSNPGTAVRPVVVSGSTTIAPLMDDIAKRFESANPGIDVEVRSGSTARGIADIRRQAADIAMVSRALAENERDLFALSICRDGAAIVVHRSNTVKGLTAAQLSDLLTGNITDWKELGGRPGRVRVAWRSEGQPIPELLLQHLRLKRAQIRSHATFFDNAEALMFVSQDRNGISFTALALAERLVKSGAAVRILPYDGVTASTRTLRDRTYPLSRPLLLVTRTVPDGMQKRFIDFAAAATDLHEKHGFVPYHE